MYCLLYKLYIFVLLLCITSCYQSDSNEITKCITMKYRFLMYGEPTSQLNMRVPESKKAEIQKKFEEILKTYENPKRFEITSGSEKPKDLKKPPKKIEPQVVEDKEEYEADLQYDKDYAEYEKVGYEKLSTFPLGSDKIKMYCGYPVFFDGTYYYTKYVEKNKGVVIVKFKKEQHVEFFILDELPRKTK